MIGFICWYKFGWLIGLSVGLVLPFDCSSSIRVRYESPVSDEGLLMGMVPAMVLPGGFLVAAVFLTAVALFAAVLEN